MNKIAKNLLSIFFILINTINISAITYTELEEDQQNAYDSLLACRMENNIQEFINILATGNNFELTNVSESSLVEEIINIQDPEVNKQKFIHILYLYGMLSEVFQQVKTGTRIRRFHTISNSLQECLDEGIPIYPKLIQKIFKSGRTGENPTSFLWYLCKKVIEKNNILNTCFKESLNWFLSRTIMFAWNKKIEKLIETIELIPFIVILKQRELKFSEIIKKKLQGIQPEKISQIMKAIKKIKEEFERREPSAFSAIFRYSLFT